ATPAAANAFRMKSYSSMVIMAMMMVVVVIVTFVVLMRGMLDIVTARQDEDVPVGVHHANFRAVELRQHRGRDHLRHGAECGMAIAEVEHAVERADQLIEL